MRYLIVSLWGEFKPFLCNELTKSHKDDASTWSILIIDVINKLEYTPFSDNEWEPLETK